MAVASYNNTPCTTFLPSARHSRRTRVGCPLTKPSLLKRTRHPGPTRHVRAARTAISALSKSMVFDQTVRGATTQTAELRWYDFRGFKFVNGHLGTPTVQQQSTFDPTPTRPSASRAASLRRPQQQHVDGLHGNQFAPNSPSLYITGRLRGDTANTMQNGNRISSRV